MLICDKKDMDRLVSILGEGPTEYTHDTHDLCDQIVWKMTGAAGTGGAAGAEA